MAIAAAELRSAAEAHPGGPELCGSADAAAYIAERCLLDSAPGRVGLELEAHCVDPADPHRRPGWAEIDQVLRCLPTFPGGSTVSVEPGGAVELSGPPLDGALSAITAMAADQAVLKSAFAAAGLGLVQLGADPLRTPGRVHPGARYAAMERFFAASHTGSAGAAMMTSTASVQVNLDAGTRGDWAQRVRLAHALGPTMVAIAANSPMLAGRSSGWRSTRQRVWSRLDSARCGPILGCEATDPAADWARYALNAPVMLVHAPTPVAITRYVSFAHWADGRVLLGGRRAGVTDLNYHLTTLFPPVRPRGWLEIRYLDSVDDTRWPAIVFTVATLLDDPVAADEAADAVEAVATAWDAAARLGLADPRLHDAARKCVALVADRAPSALRVEMQRLVDAVDRGRCPADDFADEVAGVGLVAALSGLAGRSW